MLPTAIEPGLEMVIDPAVRLLPVASVRTDARELETEPIVPIETISTLPPWKPDVLIDPKEMLPAVGAITAVPWLPAIRIACPPDAEFAPERLILPAVIEPGDSANTVPPEYPAPEPVAVIGPTFISRVPAAETPDAMSIDPPVPEPEEVAAELLIAAVLRVAPEDRLTIAPEPVALDVSIDPEIDSDSDLIVIGLDNAPPLAAVVSPPLIDRPLPATLKRIVPDAKGTEPLG